MNGAQPSNGDTTAGGGMGSGDPFPDTRPDDAARATGSASRSTEGPG